MLKTGRKAHTNKVVMLDLVVYNVFFTQQCSVLPITNYILLGSDFLDTYLAMLDIGNHNIALHYADYMLTTSLTCNPITN